MPSSMMLLVIMIVFIGIMMFTSSRANKKQRARRQELLTALKPGVWVITLGRMYGRVLDIDGDVITLESLDGTELLFDRSAIVEIKDPPFPAEDDDDITTNPESIETEDDAEAEVSDDTDKDGGVITDYNRH